MKHEKGMKELDDADYDKGVVMTMAKLYWWTLAGKVRTTADPMKQMQQQQRLKEKRHRTRRSQVPDT